MRLTTCLLVGLAACAGCALPTLEFACDASSQCGAGGTCEPTTGRCSSPDETCAAQRRYGDDAGATLAGKCVAFTCATWAECGAGGACEPDGGCSVADASCDGGRRYRDDAPALAAECVPLVAGAGIGALCGDDSHCRAEGYCASDRCITLDEMSASTKAFATHCPFSALEQGDPVLWGELDGITDEALLLVQATFSDLPACTGCGAACPAFCSGTASTRTVAMGNLHLCWAAGGTGCISAGILGQGIADTVGSLQPGITQTERVHQIMAAGPDHTCGYTGFGTAVECWGDNAAGQVDGVIPGGPTSSATPLTKTITFLPDFLAAAAGLSCAASEAAVECWGTVPWGAGLVAGLGGVISAFDVGPRHGCVVASGEVRCWGDNADRAVDPLQGAGMLPVSAPLPGITVRDVDVGDRHSCAVSVDNLVWCWGADDLGQLDGPGPGPVRAAADEPPVVGPLAAGQDVTCAVQADGVTRCWGDIVRTGGVDRDEYRICM